MKVNSILILMIIASLIGCKSGKQIVQTDHENVTVNTTITKIAGDMSKVSGQLIEFKTNEPITYANVMLRKTGATSLGRRTDESGKFYFDKLTEGDYVLIVENSDYERIEFPVSVAQATKVHLNIATQRRIYQVEKPVIYLYPKSKTEIQVVLQYAGNLTHTYPKYNPDGWTVTADTTGTLWDSNGKEYYALFWEGIPREQPRPQDGFVVSGSEVAAFLEAKLEYLGLNRREANEFIMHWLPKMESNPYNLVHFAGPDYEKMAALKITPSPESIIRVMMLTQPLASKIDFPLQDLSPLRKSRSGYSVIEWGGAVVDFNWQQLP